MRKKKKVDSESDSESSVTTSSSSESTSDTDSDSSDGGSLVRKPTLATTRAPKASKLARKRRRLFDGDSESFSSSDNDDDDDYDEDDDDASEEQEKEQEDHYKNILATVGHENEEEEKPQQQQNEEEDDEEVNDEDEDAAIAASAAQQQLQQQQSSLFASFGAHHSTRVRTRRGRVASFFGSPALNAALAPALEALRAHADAVVANLCAWLADFVARLKRCDKPGEPGMDFVFTDGPLTTALKQGRALLLEGLDQPPASVTERLNSALEFERSFNLTEDVFSQHHAGGAIAVPASFRFAATVTVDAAAAAHGHAPLRLSTALRSRLTEVWTDCYDSDDLANIVAAVVAGEKHMFADAAFGALVTLLRAVVQWATAVAAERGAVFTVRQALRLGHFAATSTARHRELLGERARLSPAHALAVATAAAEFVVLNAMPHSERRALRQRLVEALQTHCGAHRELEPLLSAHDGLAADKATRAALEALAAERGEKLPSSGLQRASGKKQQQQHDDDARDEFTPPLWGISEETRWFVPIAPKKTRSAHGNGEEDDKTPLLGLVVAGSLALAPCRRGWRVCDVLAVWRRERFYARDSVRKNLESIFFASSLGMPLLLEGAPGNGKTAIVRLVHRVLGFSNPNAAPDSSSSLSRDAAKSSVCGDFDHFVRLNATRSSTSGAMFGQYIASADQQGQQVFVWQQGALTAALDAARAFRHDLTQRTYVLLDEVNTYSSEILQAIVPYIVNACNNNRTDDKDNDRRNDSDAANSSLDDSARSTGIAPAVGATQVPAGVRVFATMNPTTVGGGRVTLPPALSNLFVRVELAEYTHDDLVHIVDHRTSGCSDWLPQRNEVRLLLRVHQKLSSMVNNRTLASVPRHENYNLRDLTMLLATVQKYAPTMKSLSHIARASRRKPADSASAGAEDDSDVSDESIAISAVVKYAQLVYARRINNHVEQQRAVDAIREEAERHTRDTASSASPASATAAASPTKAAAVVGSELKGGAASWFHELTRGDTVAELQRFVRVGVVFAPRGPERTLAVPLVHTPATVELLEAMLAASQSRCPVLLEGPLCGGKTALVRELARLCGHTLHTINLHQESDVGDLVGTWVSLSAERDTQQALERAQGAVRDAFAAVMRRLAKLSAADTAAKKYGKPCKAGLRRAEAKAVLALTQAHSGIVSLNSAVGSLAAGRRVHAFVDALGQLKRLRNERVARAVDVACDAFLRLIDSNKSAGSSNSRISASSSAYDIDVAGGAADVKTSDSKAIKFKFEYSKLIQALETGAWVLLDSVTACPPHVIERILSVLEGDAASMTLLEDGSGRTWTAASLADPSADNSGDGNSSALRRTIHPNFRLFLTATTGRAGTHKLSSALRNRVMKITVPALHERAGYTTVLRRAVLTAFERAGTAASDASAASSRGAVATTPVSVDTAATAKASGLPVPVASTAVAVAVSTAFDRVRALIASARVAAPPGLSLSYRDAVSAATMATQHALSAATASSTSGAVKPELVAVSLAQVLQTIVTNRFNDPAHKDLVAGAIAHALQPFAQQQQQQTQQYDQQQGDAAAGADMFAQQQRTAGLRDGVQRAANRLRRVLRTTVAWALSVAPPLLREQTAKKWVADVSPVPATGAVFGNRRVLLPLAALTQQLMAAAVAAVGAAAVAWLPELQAALAGAVATFDSAMAAVSPVVRRVEKRGADALVAAGAGSDDARALSAVSQALTDSKTAVEWLCALKDAVAALKQHYSNSEADVRYSIAAGSDSTVASFDVSGDSSANATEMSMHSLLVGALLEEVVSRPLFAQSASDAAVVAVSAVPSLQYSRERRSFVAALLAASSGAQLLRQAVSAPRQIAHEVAVANVAALALRWRAQSLAFAGASAVAGLDALRYDEVLCCHDAFVLRECVTAARDFAVTAARAFRINNLPLQQQSIGGGESDAFADFWRSLRAGRSLWSAPLRVLLTGVRARLCAAALIANSSVQSRLNALECHAVPVALCESAVSTDDWQFHPLGFAILATHRALFPQQPQQQQQQQLCVAARYHSLAGACDEDMMKSYCDDRRAEQELEDERVQLRSQGGDASASVVPTVHIAWVPLHVKAMASCANVSRDCGLLVHLPAPLRAQLQQQQQQQLRRKGDKKAKPVAARSVLLVPSRGLRTDDEDKTDLKWRKFVGDDLKVVTVSITAPEMPPQARWANEDASKLNRKPQKQSGNGSKKSGSDSASDSESNSGNEHEGSSRHSVNNSSEGDDDKHSEVAVEVDVVRSDTINDDEDLSLDRDVTLALCSVLTEVLAPLSALTTPQSSMSSSLSHPGSLNARRKSRLRSKSQLIATNTKLKLSCSVSRSAITESFMSRLMKHAKECVDAAAKPHLTLQLVRPIENVREMNSLLLLFESVDAHVDDKGESGADALVHEMRKANVLPMAEIASHERGIKGYLRSLDDTAREAEKRLLTAVSADTARAVMQQLRDSAKSSAFVVAGCDAAAHPLTLAANAVLTGTKSERPLASALSAARGAARAADGCVAAGYALLMSLASGLSNNANSSSASSGADALKPVQIFRGAINVVAHWEELCSRLGALGDAISAVSALSTSDNAGTDSSADTKKKLKSTLRRAIAAAKAIADDAARLCGVAGKRATAAENTALLADLNFAADDVAKDVKTFTDKAEAVIAATDAAAAAAASATGAAPVDEEDELNANGDTHQAQHLMGPPDDNEEDSVETAAAVAERQARIETQEQRERVATQQQKLRACLADADATGDTLLQQRGLRLDRSLEELARKVNEVAGAKDRIRAREAAKAAAAAAPAAAAARGRKSELAAGASKQAQAEVADELNDQLLSSGNGNDEKDADSDGSDADADAEANKEPKNSESDEDKDGDEDEDEDGDCLDEEAAAAEAAADAELVLYDLYLKISQLTTHVSAFARDVAAAAQSASDSLSAQRTLEHEPELKAADDFDARWRFSEQTEMSEKRNDAINDAVRQWELSDTVRHCQIHTAAVQALDAFVVAVSTVFAPRTRTLTATVANAGVSAVSASESASASANAKVGGKNMRRRGSVRSGPAAAIAAAASAAASASASASGTAQVVLASGDGDAGVDVAVNSDDTREVEAFLASHLSPRLFAARVDRGTVAQLAKLVNTLAHGRNNTNSHGVDVNEYPDSANVLSQLLGSLALQRVRLQQGTSSLLHADSVDSVGDSGNDDKYSDRLSLTTAVDSAARAERSVLSTRLPMWAAFALPRRIETSLHQWPGAGAAASVFAGPALLTRTLPSLAWALEGALAPFFPQPQSSGGRLAASAAAEAAVSTICAAAVAATVPAAARGLS